MPTKKGKVQIPVVVSEDLNNFLKDFSEKHDISRNHAIRHFLRLGIDENKLQEKQKAQMDLFK